MTEWDRSHKGEYKEVGGRKQCTIKGKDSLYSITERRVPELINPAVGCHYFPPGLQLTSQP